MASIDTNRVTGALYGLAYGDAYGYQVEFTDYRRIVRRHGQLGPEFPAPAVVSDDTQMSLAVWGALGDVADPGGPDLGDALLARFQDWRVDRDNNRAPGSTCMASLSRNAEGQSWLTATDTRSKGCGAVMRAPWIGLHPRVAYEDISRIAQLQAALTHGHPTAVLAADVLAHVTYELATGELELTEAAPRAWTLSTTLGYQSNVGRLWRRGGYRSAADFIETGCWDLTGAIGKIATAADTLHVLGWSCDPCSLTGEGWIAEEAVATALLITTEFHDQPELALRRAATTNGDSDSIAAIVGALVGAAHGDVWPQAWRDRLEPRYRAELAYAATETA